MSRTYAPQKTRDRLLDAAFEEIWKNGYQAASIDKILKDTRLTKGALYHHFGDKRGLAYCTVETRIQTYIRARWIQPIENVDNPIDEYIRLVDRNIQHLPENERLFGCPLSKLSREMLTLDEGFRTRLEIIINEWHAALTTALKRGQLRGYVLHDLNPEATGLYIMCSTQGMMDPAYLNVEDQNISSIVDSLKMYLESIRGETEPQVYESRWSDFID